ncbi:MAG: proton glutamate symport protein [Candidatus Azotimanducaceae bacterium]|jgi:proton glutamate symport protein
MNVTAVYQTVVAVFLAQVHHDLSLASIVLIGLTAAGASIGTPATPDVCIVILFGILSGIGETPPGVALIIALDPILDMCRTSVNLSGDLAATFLLDQWFNTDQQDSSITATHQDTTATNAFANPNNAVR